MLKRIFCAGIFLALMGGASAWGQSTGLSRAGTLSHIAAGGPWDTMIWLINNSTATVNVELDLHADDGSALTVPLTITQQGATQSITASKVSGQIAPDTALMVDTGLTLANTVTGWADVFSSGPVSGFAIFRSNCSTCTPSEGTVPLQNSPLPALVIPYDNTQGFVTGIALANLSTTAANLTSTIWDEYGNRYGGSPIAIPASGHTSFVATTGLPATTGNRGIVQFQNPTGGAIDGLGLRFSPYGTFTSVPTTPQAPGVQIASLSPASIQAGSTVTLTVNGSNLSGVTALQLTPSTGISVSNVAASANQVTATVYVAAYVAAETVNVSVSSATGTSNILPLAIQSPTLPQITSLGPTSGQQGTSVTLTINGSYLSGVTGVQVSPSTGITVSNVRASATQVTASLSIGSSAPIGPVSVSVSSLAGPSNTLTFTVTQGSIYDGHWAGTTSQTLPVSLTVTNNIVTAYSYGLSFPSTLPANCPTGATVTSGSATAISISGGSFSTSSISGWFQSTTAANGSIKWTLSLPGCSANGVVSWNATKQ